MRTTLLILLSITLLGGCANLRKRTADVSEILCYSGANDAPYFKWSGNPKDYKIRKGTFHILSPKKEKGRRRLLGTMIGNCIARNFWKDKDGMDE